VYVCVHVGTVVKSIVYEGSPLEYAERKECFSHLVLHELFVKYVASTLLISKIHRNKIAKFN
jgi:hypothetical protein